MTFFLASLRTTLQPIYLVLVEDPESNELDLFDYYVRVDATSREEVASKLFPITIYWDDGEVAEFLSQPGDQVDWCASLFPRFKEEMKTGRTMVTAQGYTICLEGTIRFENWHLD